MTEISEMTLERQREVYAAFSAALDREPAERAMFLESRFPDDSFRDEVARLLRHAEAAGSESFLQGPAFVIDDVPLRLPDFRDGNREFSDLEYIGHGGMGVVYKAYDKRFATWVALKFIALNHLDSDRERERFRSETQSMAKLRHPNIVTVYPPGEYEGRPYIEMQLIQGGSLHDRLDAYLERPQDAAALVENVALAVHHAHQRGILHNDLKPGNILLDEESRPYVVDFGLARRIGDDVAALATRTFERSAGVKKDHSLLTTRTATGAIEGTITYMSPEQAEGKEVTTLSDVYGLGAILYTLLTGLPPFSGGTALEILERVKTADPKPPSALNPRADRTLEAICLKCLHKDPRRRYASANGVAQDLLRYRTARETTARPWTRRERIAAWAGQNMIESVSVAAVIAIGIFAVVLAWTVAQAQREQRVKDAMAHAQSTADDLAKGADQLLANFSRHVEIAALEAGLPEYMAKDNRVAMERIVADLCREQPVIEFTTCYILNRDGTMLAHFPPDAALIEEDFSWRDYFRGAEQRGKAGIEGAYISRIYRGASDQLYKFGIAAPIFDSQKRFLGAAVTSVKTSASLGPIIPADGRKAALIGPEDINSPDEDREASKDRYLVFFHFAYPDRATPAAFPYSGKLRMKPIPSDDRYIDPVVGGRWIAGFAPVKNTEFLFLVQERYDDAVKIEASTLWSLALWSALASIVAVAILAATFWRWARTRRTEA